ncbi:SIS domain-containing protein [Nocardioides euryhalodurans]|uniref:Bifunctional glucose-6-phosphate/mannose-6-phosphate isomerase C-terminal domain-containing protein n=1 Tax=Nocardioides euryhalodurans TaxID=2518370 RepID=A0A4P7GIY5_9ACTN|nr:SIS domain-containing protein [Nocardioides euryhalodurans]QBR91968.1 hypothetical protein EXE57_06515 [Nocardioides euryhalodurans]
MATWFDESRLDDEAVWQRVDGPLRALAESGARVRREVGEAAGAIADAVSRSEEQQRPRAVIAAGPDSRLLRAVLEPWCPVPFVAWPGPSLPGWAGGLDLVVVLAPDGGPSSASAVAEAVRRGCQLVVACPPSSMVAEHAAGRWSSVLPTTSGDQLATAVVMLEYLEQVRLGPRVDADRVASALDEVAIACSPHRDLAVNPAKMLAIALADTTPVVWGGGVLAARAARRIAEQLRRASGRTALAGDAEHLLPVLEATPQRDVFDDPFADEPRELRPMLLVLDDGSEEPLVREERGQLRAAAASRGIRVETLTTDAPTEVARYASLLLSGSYAAAYLRLGLVED